MDPSARTVGEFRQSLAFQITPEEWVQLEHQRRLLIRKIAQVPKRAQYFVWSSTLFSGTASDVKLTLKCLANDPVDDLSSFFVKPEKPVHKRLRGGDKTASSGSAPSKSIAMQARQAGKPCNKGKPGELNKLLSSDLLGNDDILLGYHKITSSDLENEEHLCQRYVKDDTELYFEPAKMPPSGRVRPGSGYKSASWWRSLLAAYRAVTMGKALTDHNIRLKHRAIRRNRKSASLGETPKHSAPWSDRLCHSRDEK